MSQTKCPGCNARLAEDYQFCPACGYSLAALPPIILATPVRQGRRDTGWARVVLGVLAVGLVVVGSILLLRSLQDFDLQTFVMGGAMVGAGAGMILVVLTLPTPTSTVTKQGSENAYQPPMAHTTARVVAGTGGGIVLGILIALLLPALAVLAMIAFLFFVCTGIFTNPGGP